MGVPVKKSGKGSKSSKPSRPRQLTAEDYFLEAEMAYFSDDIDAARAAFKRALDKDSDNPEYLDVYGAFLAENGPRDEAIEVLQRACELLPNEGFEKYMYLGQVLDSQDRTAEAEASMRRGVEILRKEFTILSDANEMHHGNDDDEDAESTRQHVQEALSSALCSLSELLMGAAAEAADESDAVDDAAAALAASPALVECETLLGEARELNATSPEPLQVLSSLRKLQGRDEEALMALRQSMALWYSPTNTEGRQVDAGEANEELTHVDNLPSYEFRFECARLLYELEENKELAASVLEGLLEENDGVPDVWLLLAVAYRAGGELEAAGEAAVEGAKVARKLGLPSDHEVVAALDEIGEELKGNVGAGGIEEKRNEV